MAKSTSKRLRGWLILASALLLSLLFSASALAQTSTDPGGDRFAIMNETTATVAYFTIIDGDDCDDTDENCTVIVRLTPATSGQNITNHTTPSGNGTTDHEDAWKEVFEAACTLTGSDGSENEDFEECWKSATARDTASFTFDVEWPIIKLGGRNRMFDVRPHCDDNDDECSVELGICYNPEDCRGGGDVDEATDEDEASNQIAEFWSDAGSCLYDDDEEDVWECIDDEFQDWLDDELSSSDDYDDLIDELERSTHDDLGLSILDYDDDLRNVFEEDEDDDEDPETTLERYQRLWRNARPESIYNSEDEVEEGSYSFRPTQDDYLIINFTNYLDLESPVRVCNTPVGCFTLTGKSTVFRQYMKSFFVFIADRKIIRCMDNRGWDTDDDHLIPFNHPDLIACDERIKTAVQHCPAENIGAKQILFSLYDVGLLNGLVNPSFAQQLRNEVEQARVRAPSCLCAAGFKERDMIISNSRSGDPWEYSGGARWPLEACDV